jgi:hypothetical protein
MAPIRTSKHGTYHHMASHRRHLLLVTKFRSLYLYRNDMKKNIQSMQIWYKGRVVEGNGRKQG